MYRYRSHCGSTRLVRPKFTHCAKLGTIWSVAGVRQCTKGIKHERVVVLGHRGSARFDALCWGYHGEGPRGLRDLLLFLGLQYWLAEAIAFGTQRLESTGTDWWITLPRYEGGDAEVFGVTTLVGSQMNNVMEATTFDNDHYRLSYRHVYDNRRPVTLLGGE